MSVMKRLHHLFSASFWGILNPKMAGSHDLACLEALYELSHEGMLITDGSRIVAVNPALVAMAGYDTADELVGRNVQEFTPSSMKGRFDNIYQLNATGPYVVEMLRKNGEVFLVESVGRNIFHFGRRLRVAIVRDLSQASKGVEPSAFAQSEERSARIFNASPSVMTITTLRDGMYIDVNKAFEKMFGFSRDEVVGRTSVDVGIWHKLEARAAFVEELARKGRVENFFSQFNAKSGRVVDLLLSAEPITFDGTPCIILTGFDVSDRARADKATQLLHIEAEKAKNFQSRFLSNISHELRNPLNAIIGFASGMSQGVWGRIENERHENYIKAIQDSGEALVLVINDLLDLSRLETGRLTLNRELVDLSALMLDCVGEVKEKCETSGVDLSVNINVNTRPSLLDRGRTKQALCVLLNNTLSYTHKGCEVQIHLYEILDGLAIVIEDNGIGIEEKDIEYVFEPLSSAFVPKDAGHGSRMAMPLAKGLIEAQGGRIDLKSVFGEGTRIVITLPALEPPAEALD